MEVIIVVLYAAAFVVTACAVTSIWMAERYPQSIVDTARRLTRHRDTMSGAQLRWRDDAAQVVFGAAVILGFAVIIYGTAEFILGWAPTEARSGIARLVALLFCIPTAGLVWNYADAKLKR